MVQQRSGERIYAVADIASYLAGDPGGLARKLGPYPRNNVIPTAGTWLGAFDVGLFFAGRGHTGGPGQGGQQANPIVGKPLRSFIDAGPYFGQPGTLTLS